jgi:hypothetical protein
MTSTTDVTDLTGDDTHDEHNEQDDGHGKHHPRRTYDVTVRTPAGFGRDFRVRATMLVETLTSRAADYFAHHGQLAGDNWRLELVVDGHSAPLVASARLGDAGVHAGAMLALVSAGPQVDG